MNKKEKILLELHIDYYKNSNTKFLNISELKKEVKEMILEKYLVYKE